MAQIQALTEKQKARMPSELLTGPLARAADRQRGISSKYHNPHAPADTARPVVPVIAPAPPAQPALASPPPAPGASYNQEATAQQAQGLMDWAGAGGFQPQPQAVPMAQPTNDEMAVGPAFLGGPVAGAFQAANTARLGIHPDVRIAGQMQDTGALQQRINALPTIQNRFGGDVAAYQRSQDLQRSGAAGMVPRAENLSYGGRPIGSMGGFERDQRIADSRRGDESMEEFNQRRKDIATVRAENSTLAMRRAEARRLRNEGQDVPMPMQRTIADVQREREQQANAVQVAAAANPPRPAPGSTSQPKVTTKEDILANAARNMSADDFLKVKQALEGMPEDFWTALMNQFNGGSGSTQPATTNAGAAPSAPTPQDLEFTAKKYGITVEEVKKRLGIQ